jgi:hemerythrin-like domain-containing protein
MPADHATYLSEMLAVHDCLRHEFARMPLTVKAVREGDDARAATLGEHILLMLSVLQAHEDAEDEVLWPLLVERAPEGTGLVETHAAEHQSMGDAADTIRMEAAAWMATPGILERSALHTTLIRLEKELLHHLAVEEQGIAQLIERHVTVDELASVQARTRAGLTTDQAYVVLGLILKNTSTARGAAVLQGLNAEEAVAFDEFGRPAYEAYAERLSDY